MTTRQLLSVGGVLLAAVGGGIIGRALGQKKPEPKVTALPPAPESEIPEAARDQLADLSKRVAAATHCAVDSAQLARRAAAELAAADKARQEKRLSEAARRTAEAEYLQTRSDRAWDTYVDAVAAIDTDRSRERRAMLAA